MPRLYSPQQSNYRIAETRLESLRSRAYRQVEVDHVTESHRGFLVGWMRKFLMHWLNQIKLDQITLLDGAERVICGEQHTPQLSATLQVTDSRFYWHLFTAGSLGAAEAYLRGYWRSKNLTTLMRIFARQENSLTGVDHKSLAWLSKPWQSLTNWVKRNSRTGSRRNIAAHYDLSNDFFALFLDPTMTYSSGIFPSASSSMEEASLTKYDRLCRKLRLSPADHVLEIGTGWGGFAIYAAEQYGCRVTTTTISDQQRQMAEQRVKQAGLSHRISILGADYRDLQGAYDKLVSIEMIEAVGHRYLPTYFQHCCRLLKPDGIFALQAITIPDQRYETYRRGIDFIQRYIFPGGCLPSIGAMQAALVKDTDFQLIHLEDFAPHYARTLENWQLAFQNREMEIRDLGMDDRFVRAWEYYFAYCRAGFEERQVGVSQLVFARGQARLVPLWEGLQPQPEHTSEMCAGVRDA